MIFRNSKWHNGILYSWDISSIPSGYRLGDGVFETIRTYNGVPFRLESHVKRLIAGAGSIGLKNLPAYDIVLDQIKQNFIEARTGQAGLEWILRPTFFSDKSNWGFVVPVEPWNSPNDFVNNKGVSVGASEYPHPGNYLVPPSTDQQVKWLSRGPLSHALREATVNGWKEALLLNPEQRVIEGTRSNILMFLEDRIIAPGKLSGAFPGITREVAIECAGKGGMEVEDRPITLNELKSSGEILLTSSLLGIVPAISVSIQGNTFRKTLGEKSKILLSDFEVVVKNECSIDISLR
jgi:branched-subunit amino acid aminotransferase/4-amino-4-deoxychorismate lyase